MLQTSPVQRRAGPERADRGFEGTLDNIENSALAVLRNVKILGNNAIIEPEESIRLKVFEGNG